MYVFHYPIRVERFMGKYNNGDRCVLDVVRVSAFVFNGAVCRVLAHLVRLVHSFQNAPGGRVSVFYPWNHRLAGLLEDLDIGPER